MLEELKLKIVLRYFSKRFDFIDIVSDTGENVDAITFSNSDKYIKKIKKIKY